MLKTVLVPVHRAGWPFILGMAGVTVIGFLTLGPVAWIGVVLTCWCVYFFRDPPRVTPTFAGLIICPADGLLLPIGAAVPPPELAMGEAARTRISIFMNVFDVHVNRVPCDGRVIATAYRPGRFVNASLDKASQDNERMSVRICPAGQPSSPETDLAVVQIAGLVARRIRCDLKPDDEVRAGARMGIIRFGSRVDVYLPPGVAPLVVAGQQMVAGETVLADPGHTGSQAREGEVR